MQYKIMKNGTEYELEIEYQYDFEHREVGEDSLCASLDDVEITDFLSEQEYWDIFHAVEAFERESCKRPWNDSE